MKALIVYGSRYGTAAEIAEEIGKVIEVEGVEVDLIDSRGLKDCDVSHYDLVVVGSGIKIGKWTKGSLKFLKKNKSALKYKKLALFVTCGAANDPKTIDEGQEKYLQNEPVATGIFGSVYDPNAKHGILYEVTTRFKIKKELEKQGKDTGKRHDYRNYRLDAPQ